MDELKNNYTPEPETDSVSDMYSMIQETETARETEPMPAFVPVSEEIQELGIQTIDEAGQVYEAAAFVAETISEPVLIHEPNPAPPSLEILHTKSSHTKPHGQTAKSSAATPPPRRKERTSFKSAVILVVLGTVLGGFSLGAGFGVVTTAARVFFMAFEEEASDFAYPYETSTEVLAFSNQPSASPRLDEDMPTTFSEVVRMVKPSVVSISSVMGGNQNFFSMPETPKGSGIIFKEDDEKVYIITNYHVIGGAQSVSVSVNGGAPVSAGLVGREQPADLAVIYILKEDLEAVGIHNVTVAMFGDSTKMQEGDLVLAIGNAMGEGNSTTLGIISVLSKDIRVEGKDLTVIQTDAAINPGNSGGALVNMRGEVIGINTAKTINSPLGGLLSGMGGSAEGMGYSIASNDIVPIVNEIMLMKPRPFLGIQGKTLSEEFASLYSIPALGVLVEDVIPNTAAELAGLKKWDIITAFKGQPVFTMEDLQASIRECEVGEEVEINILRDGRMQMTVKAKLLVSDDTNF